MNRGLHFVAHKLILVHFVNGIYGNFSQPGRKPGRQPGQKLFSQGIWPGTPWCSGANEHSRCIQQITAMTSRTPLTTPPTWTPRIPRPPPPCRSRPTDAKSVLHNLVLTLSHLVTLTFDLLTFKWGHGWPISWASFLPILS